MPIHLPQFQPRLAVCGHVKNGRNEPVVDRQTGKPKVDDRTGNVIYRPQQLDHYIITTLQKDRATGNFVEDTKAMASLRQQMNMAEGEKITRMPILVPSDDFEEFLPTGLAARKGKTICCRGTGKGKAKRWNVEGGMKIGKPFEADCPCSWLPESLGGPGGAVKQSDPNCKMHGTLRFKIALSDTITIGSIYDYHTTSQIGLPNLLGGFAEIQSMIGTLVWVPLWLELRPEKVQPEGHEKTVYSSFVHLRGSDIKVIQDRAISMVEAAQRVQKLAGRTTLLPLPPARIDDEDEEEDVLEEFDPPHDPVTGEVWDTHAVEKPAAQAPPPAVPASQLPKGSGYVTTTAPTTGTGDVGSDAPKPGADRLAPPGTPPPSAVSTQTEIPMIGSTPASAPGPAAAGDPSDLNALLSSLPEDAAQRVRLPHMLTKLGELRGLSDKALEKGRKEILAEFSAIAAGKVVAYKALTVGQAEGIIALLETAIVAARKKDEGHDDRAEPVDDVPPPEDDEIP